MEAVIVGVGLHPFGRFPGKSAMDMAADAVRLALADAGVGWPQVQTGFIGSLEVANPDAIVGRLGLTGIPLRGVFNGCATAGSALAMAARANENGECDEAIAIGMDKHPRGAFAADPSVGGLPGCHHRPRLRRAEELDQRGHAGLDRLGRDVLRRLDAEHLDPGRLEVLEQVAVVARDLDDPRPRSELEPPGHRRRERLAVVEPRAGERREVRVLGEDLARGL